MKVAIITGASAGLGKEFLRSLPDMYPEIEEYWLIARRREKLEEAAVGVRRQCRIFPLDLTLDESYEKLAAELSEQKPDIKLLINNSGCGNLGNVGDGELRIQTQMIDLNLKGLTAVTHLCIPYMQKGSNILNISSIASFCPNPRMTVYSATKSFVTAFTFGIAEELKEKGITATAVCPGPMDTEFIKIGGIKGNSKTFDILPYCDPEKVARESLAAARRGVTVHTPKAFYKLYRVIAKILPTKLMIKFSKT
ncbi:MAG: SDR family NAD(P)-dependent oxidoreductase [Ruminococcaceae bacterium]|nr:SDR family NAD(P)-dependent oxidoreductase [Oscillospiraceae bacterium]